MNKTPRLINVAILVMGFLPLWKMTHAADMDLPLRGSCLWAGTTDGFFADDKFVLFAEAGIVVYDASSADSLVELKRYTENCDRVWDFVVSGHRVYTWSRWHGVGILEFDCNWLLIRATRNLRIGGYSFMGGIDLVDENHIVARSYWGDSDRIIIANMADPDQPFIQSMTAMPSDNYMPYGYQDAIAYGDSAVAICRPNTVVCFTMNGDYSLTRAGEYQQTIMLPDWYYIPNELAIRSDTLFVRYSANSPWHTTPTPLEIVSLAEPFNPTLIGRITMPFNTVGMRVFGDTIFAPNAAEEMIFVDVSSPATPTIVDSLHYRGFSSGIVIDGNRLVISSGLGAGSGGGILQLPDTGVFRGGDVALFTRTGESWTLTQTLQFSFGTDMVINGYPIIACLNPSYGGDIKLVDITNKEHPRVLGKIENEYEPFAGCIAGNMLHVAYSRKDAPIFPEGVNVGAWGIYDISDPQIPEQMSLTLLESVYDVAVQDTLAFVGTLYGLRIYDISDPTYPSLLSLRYTNDVVGSVDVRGDRVALAVGEAGAAIIDVSNPLYPTVFTSYAPPYIYPGSIDFLPQDGLFCIGFGGCRILAYDSVGVVTLISDIDVWNNGAVSVNKSFVGFRQYMDGFSVFDVANPALPKLAAEQNGRDANGPSYAYWVEADTNAIISVENGSVKFFDPPIPTKVSEDLETHIKTGSAISLSLRSDNRSQSISLVCRSPRREVASIKLYNIVGQCVANVFEGEIGNAPITIDWRAGDRGRPLASGVYFFKLQTPSGSVTQKWKLLK